jgi:hypothetical protein
VTPEQEQVAGILASARAEALENRPLSCAAVNSVARRLADMWEERDPAFSREEFCAAANYRGGMPEGIPV